MDVTLEKIKSMVDSNTIIGNTINMADGTLVLPISKVTFCLLYTSLTKDGCSGMKYERGKL